MESNAVGTVPRLALKTRFSEMGWGSTPLLSANNIIKEIVMSGKGSKPRPFSVAQEEYNSRWDAIFGRDLQKFDEAVFKNEYQDVLSTEECLDQGPQMLFENKS